MANNFSKGFIRSLNSEKTSDDFDALLLIAMAENEKGNYQGQSFINPEDDVL